MGYQADNGHWVTVLALVMECFLFIFIRHAHCLPAVISVNR